ncbi:small subunit processome component 20 homolog [Neodiprion virginianus]|uniref:small subunit processome component 20 homolog n=1 Tax=Neodiprion virginianus TaxID=2961670 RepID=UPI001EE6A844|nr:small subunit processome component 20 homolog [Neodiprion virginianus]
MKNKPTRHKESNTFKFKPFSERIADIDVDVFHRVSHRNEAESDEVETHFYQCLHKWSVLNLTENYTNLKKELRGIVTLPQLLNSKEHVIDALLKYLRLKDTLCLQPILELVIAAARDLQKEFYEYFPQFLTVIIDLLHTNDAEQLEYTFTALAYLFKFLWRYLIKNVDAVFDLLLPLLAESKPTYINDFAAESFAFVVRKVKDKDAFLELLINALEKRPDGVSGCGKLLFQVIQGTTGQFHSCAEQMLTLYIGSLKNESIDKQMLYSILQQVVQCLVNSIHPQKSEIFWNVSLRLADLFLENYEKSSGDTDELKTEKENALFLLHSLLLEAVNHRDGRMLVHPNQLINELVKALDFFENKETTVGGDKVIVKGLAKLSGSVLLAQNVKLTQEYSNKLVRKILAIRDIEILLSVVEQLISYSSFETLVLPHFMTYSFQTGFNSDILRLFSKIITVKSPLCLNGTKLKEWTRYNLNIRNIPGESLNHMQNILTALNDNAPTEDSLRLLITLPHLSPVPKICEETLLEATKNIYGKLKTFVDINSDLKLDLLSFTFLLAIESVAHILQPNEFYEYITKHDINLSILIDKYSTVRSILCAVDLCLSHIVDSEIGNNLINIDLFNSLNESLAPLLGSPYHKDRLVIAHIYSLFSNVKDILATNDQGDKNFLALPYLAEAEPSTVHCYRDKLLPLQGLAFERILLSNFDSKYLKFPIYCLFGNLYVNFSLLWDPIMKLIASYAHKQCDSFWPIFISKLESAKTQGESETTSLLTFDCDVTSTLLFQVFDNEDKPDYNNYSLLLWKCMSLFSDFCEMKNRDLTGIFIDFVESNFFKSNSEDAKSWSIKKHEGDNELANQIVQETEDDDEIEHEKATKNDLATNKISFDGKHKIKLLLAQMEIFSKVKNPRTLYREADMYKIYLELLASKNSEVQKSALNCLFTYKHKYLVPYKEHLYNLIDEKSLKNELALFKIDKESNMIQDDHREALLPILMRIIYAKMVMRTGMRTGGKAGGLVRRTIVLRFLAGTQEDEMMTFISMAFKLFHKYVPIASEEELNLNEMVRDVVNNLDLSNIIPPKRLQSSVNLLAIVIEQFGGKMSSKLLPRLLGILICILAQVTGISHRSNDVHPGYMSSIRNLRTSCMNILSRFFSHYESYEWTESEIDALFAVAVFPWLEKLPIEGIHSPTALLKLFIAWSQNPRYYPLFAKHFENNLTLTPLPYVIQLLLGPKTHGSVINAILEMIEKMLTLQDYGVIDNNVNQMDVDAKFFPIILINNMLEVKQNSTRCRTDNINYGSALLLPHVPNILEYIKKKLNKSNKGVNKIELVVLSRISEFVEDSETCDTLLTLLLPILVKKATTGASEEIVVQLVSTIFNLMKIVEHPEKHLRLIVPLTGAITAVSARKSLMRLYNIISEGSSEQHRDLMIRNCKLLVELNAWDSKWIDQPDFDKRLEAFKEVNTLLEEDALTLEFGATIIYNCFFFLKTEKDLALRDLSGQCLKTIAPKLVRKYKDRHLEKNYLIDETILSIVRMGIRDKNEIVRNQSIALLGQLAMECSDVHPVLRDLHPLSNKADPEVDVFENLQHLQLHRKARALLKFCSIAKTWTRSPNPKTLTQFILPLASSYLCSESFVNKNSIVDAAIETVGTVCRLLPWHQYEVVLKYYLDKLRSSVEFQKQTIRIVVAILDAFHYNLSKYKEPASSVIAIVNTEDVKEPDPLPSYDEGSVLDGIPDMDEKLDESLADDAKNLDESEPKSGNNSQINIPAMQRELFLSQFAARRLVFGISKVLLPQLNRSIMARTQHENSHKVNRKKTGFEREEEEIMRVPIALAVVKLLQKLPPGVLEENLPGILMKLCTFLKSRLDSVRRITRETMQKIMITLGPEYLRHLLKEMNNILTKGFQVHVLVYTIHAVLVSLKPYYKPLHINENLHSILSVCKVDLFGLTGEEKEIAGIVKNVSEAKSTKSFDIFHILAQFITESCLLDLVMPLKNALIKTHSYKIIRKVVECLRQVVLGLADNTFIEINKMLTFLYGVISESIPDLLLATKPKQVTEREAEIKARQKPDCLIIAPEPKNRMGVKAQAKTSSNANAHIMVEFGLRLYHILLKRDRISAPELKSYLDPVVSILSDCLKSQHVKLTTLALQCLNWILKTDLPSVKTYITEICSSMFNILHKYAAAGLSKGDNFDLVTAAFKCMSVLVRDVKDFTINSEQLKILILYAEQDLHDYDKQGTAFTLLRAILSRKLIVPEMHDVMEKVAKLSVTSELDHVRQQARSIFHIFLMEYPLGKFLEKHLSFYLTQLSYEVKSGRLSALEMIHGIITGFPLTVLSQHSGLFFLMIGARLANDEDPDCRKLCAKCIKEMIIRLPHNDKNKLFDIILLWLKEVKVSHRRLAAQLCGIFITVEKQEFESRLAKLLPLVLKQFNDTDSDDSEPGRFVRIKKQDISNSDDFRKDKKKLGDSERMRDHHLFQVLQMFLKLSSNCPSFLKDEKYEDAVCILAAHSQSLLAHPHLWVRLAAAQLIGFILAAIDVEKVADALENPESYADQKGYIYSDPVATMKSLALDLAAQLQPELVFEDLADQVVKNLIFVARALKSFHIRGGKKPDNHSSTSESDGDRISLFWLVKRMRKIVNVEVTQSPKSTAMRTAVFKWTAGVVATISVENLNPVLFHLMSPLVREMTTTEESNAPLRHLAKDVATMIKKSLGSEEYMKLLSKVQQKLDTKRAEQKKSRTQEFITDPELAAKRKIARQQKKKEAKKRKMETMKGRKSFGKKPRREVNFDAS